MKDYPAMSQLTEISVVTKKIAFWCILTFIGFVIFKFTFDAFVIYWKKTHPIGLYPPQMEFGKLPHPKFSHVIISTSGLTFKLENVEGLPLKNATPSGRVYSMPKKLPSIIAAQRARDFAAKLYFNINEEALSSTYYRFTNIENKFKTLEIDINNMNFKLLYDYKNNFSVFSADTFQNKDKVIREVKDFIQYNNLFDASMLNGRIETTNLYYDIQTNTASVASSLSNANMMRINFFRGDVDNKKIVPPVFNESYNYALYTPASDPKNRILQLVYTFWPIAMDDIGTYPLRSSEMAWQDLIDGYAIVVNMGNNTVQNQIIIRNIYLAYYDSEEPQNYLQLIYVFEGDNDFVAYLPAVSSDWLE